MSQDAVGWAESEFQGTPGLNIRFQRRLIETAAKLATRPQGTLPHRLTTWPELKGCYRLVHAVAHPDSVHVVDRGADIFGAMVTARRQDTHLLFRLVHDRQLQTPVGPNDDPATHLLNAARQVEATTQTPVEIASRGGRSGRTAAVNLGAVRLAFRATRTSNRANGFSELIWTRRLPKRC